MKQDILSSRKFNAPAIVFLSLSLLLCSTRICAQSTLSLSQAVKLAKESSPYYQIAKNTFERSYWRMDNFKAGFKPQVRFNATVPTFYRAITPVTQPDGTIKFIRVSQANNTLGIGVRQNVGFLGGVLSANTSLQRTDNFSGNQSSFFLTTPIQVSYVQGSLLYNEFAWQKKLEPLLFEKANKGYSEDLEIASLEVTKLFLAGVRAQVAVTTAKNNLANIDTLHSLSKERFKIGTVPQTDLLQLELNLLRAKSDLNVGNVTLASTLRDIKRVLGIANEDSLVLLLPEPGIAVHVSYERALEEAISNRPDVLRFRAERLLADQEIAKAKGQNGLDLSLLANFGTQQTAGKLIDSYRGLQNQQYIGVALDIPIQDWGYRRSQIRLARANRELVEVNMHQNQQAFEQEVYIQVLQFNQNFDQLQLAKRADSIANLRLSIAKERYLLGKLGIFELNFAFQESGLARRGYVNELSNYWISFYILRRLTLFDFITNRAVEHK